ncbi:hypothetical protein BH09ACT7_BH09ACT7_17770 [soil metagenome]
MGLFNRASDVEIVMSPAVATPRQTVTATITTAKPVDKVTTASLEWGYTNFFNYHWAGKADSLAAGANDALSAMGEVGTNYGGDRDTDEWVCVTRVELPLGTSGATGEFTGGSWTFRVPSWAPPSSKEIARWSARLIVDRGGRDLDVHGEFTVKIGPADVVIEDEPMEVLSGAAETVIDIVLPTSVFVAGEAIRGHAVLTPTMDLPDGDLAVSWQRRRASHPLTRNPSAGGSLDGKIVPLGKRIPLRAGAPITLPFEIPLPADVPPTSAAVHSSMDWYVQARMFYAGFTGHMMERVVRPIVVVNTL